MGNPKHADEVQNVTVYVDSPTPEGFAQMVRDLKAMGYDDVREGVTDRCPTDGCGLLVLRSKETGRIVVWNCNHESSPCQHSNVVFGECRDCGEILDSSAV